MNELTASPSSASDGRGSEDPPPRYSIQEEEEASKKYSHAVNNLIQTMDDTGRMPRCGFPDCHQRILTGIAFLFVFPSPLNRQSLKLEKKRIGRNHFVLADDDQRMRGQVFCSLRRNTQISIATTDTVICIYSVRPGRGGNPKMASFGSKKTAVSNFTTAGVKCLLTRKGRWWLPLTSPPAACSSNLLVLLLPHQADSFL